MTRAPSTKFLMPGDVISIRGARSILQGLLCRVVRIEQVEGWLYDETEYVIVEPIETLVFLPAGLIALNRQEITFVRSYS